MNIEFEIPFPQRVSRFLPWVRPRTLAWVREPGLIRSARAERRFLSWNLVDAAARVFPNAASADDLLKLANFFAVGFLFDDEADYRSAVSVDRYVRVAHELLTIPLRPPNAPLELACPTTRALKEIWQRTTGEMSPRWCDRFALDYARFHTACAHEARLSARGQVPVLSSYLGLRRATVGILYSLDQTEWAGRYELPPLVPAHPLFTELRNTTNDIVAWMNDIHSHEREIARNDPHNLLTVLTRRHGMTARQASAGRGR